ncbi:MAG: alkaline phosphatase D family protein [Thermosynechococcaceae cyanobacterium]
MSHPALLTAKLKRRSFLLGTSAMAGSVIIAKTWSDRVLAQPKFPAYPFSLGVASGDPWPNSVVLWTRLVPDPLKGISLPPAAIPIQWQVATDPKMSQVVADGTVLATPELAHSVRVVVDRLEPGRQYWYRFKAGTELSPIGRTKTAPSANAALKQLNFAFASCQHYEFGYYNAYRHMANADLDMVFHLGDYIYEGAPSQQKRVRQHIGPRATDLDSYRLRYALYKSDPDLQAAHAAFPFICTWDDHEVENDYANDISPKTADPVSFLQRRQAAYQAYYEHMPLRPASMPQGNQMQLYRRFTFGDLAEFSVLDTRQYRDKHPCGDDSKLAGSDCLERIAPERSMLGKNQEDWLLAGLAQSKTRWTVIAQQYLMAELALDNGTGQAYRKDGWDGYAASRRRILEALRQTQAQNPITLGGDIHSFWVSDLKPDFQDPKSPVVATEFVGTSISSQGPTYELLASFLPKNPHIKYFESRYRGYMQCSVTPKQWTSRLQVVDTVAQPKSTLRTLATYVVEAGRPGAQQA